MKLSQKAKYFTFGIVATAVILPLAIFAAETIKTTFKEGDVVSATVINALLDRVEKATNTFTADDLVGTWSITQIVPYNGQPGNGGCRLSSSCSITGTTDAADGMTRFRTDTVVITKSGSTYSYTQANVSSFTAAHTNTPDSGTVSVMSEAAIFKNASGQYQFYYAKKKGAEKIVLQDIQSSSGSFNMVILQKSNLPPAPADTLVATVSGTTSVLTWTDQSSDESGFKVQRKTSVTGAWTDLTTTAANAVAYTDSTVTTGTYWYRVLATNANGDSMSSSEVQAVLP